jgi:hypothetical protein
MEQVVWRVYRIEDKHDLVSALELYRKRFGTVPIRARVSEKAPEDLLFLVREAGLEIEVLRPILPRDVWLTHEEEQTVPQAQLSLFGE